MDNDLRRRFEVEVRDLLASLADLAKELSEDSYLSKCGEDLSLLRHRLVESLATPSSYEVRREISHDIKRIFEHLSKYDWTSDSFELCRDLIYVFQDARFSQCNDGTVVL